MPGKAGVSNMMLSSYPSLYQIGHRALAELLLGPVLIEEKVDGSQISFGVSGGRLFMRSRNCEIDVEAPDGMFARAVAAVREFESKLVDGWIYRGEYLQKPKHNVLAYDRHPERNIILFDITTAPETYLSYESKVEAAGTLGLEVVPRIYEGKLDDLTMLPGLLDRVSILGGQKIEGVVVKNYLRFGQDKKILIGKFVSADFKEIHKKEWGEANPKQGDILDRLAVEYRTPARWNKAIQHLAEAGELTNSPADIGKLMKECGMDIRRECEEEIKQRLFDWAWKTLGRKLTQGLPEYYKERLAREVMGGG